MSRFLAWLGQLFLRSFPGQLLELAFKNLHCLFARPDNPRLALEQALEQAYFTGVEASPLVAFLAVVIGSATILQAVTVMPKIGAGDYFGNVMVVVVLREVGPLFTAFLVAGRTGSALSTFLGNMKAQQEIDALVAMGVDPVRYLLFPNFAGTVVSMFGLTVLFNCAAIFGGYFVVQSLALLVPAFAETQMSLGLYLGRILASLGVMDGVIGIVKPVFFGALVSLVASLHGMGVSGDIREVPQATTRAVVRCFTLIILFDTLFAFPFLAQLELL